MMFCVLTICLSYIPLLIVSACTPEISKGSHSHPNQRGHISLECEIAGCTNVSKILYEKTSIRYPALWTTVIEGVDRSNNNAVNASNIAYSLDNRYEYAAFVTHHILYIDPLTTEDQGLWRCSVHLSYNTQVKSQTIEVYLAHSCKPELSKGSHSELTVDGHTFLECGISTCSNVSAVVFEKKGFHPNSLWTPVYEGFEKYENKVLKESNSTYTLENRSDYAVFVTHHILYIDPLKRLDQGLWRCAVQTRYNRPTQSLAIELFLASPCKPEISEGQHSNLTIGGHTSLECEITTCERGSRVQFEKKNIHPQSQWTTVYEGFNKTNYHAIYTAEHGYSIKSRADYAAFRSHHILYIKPLELDDQGLWRCVVYGQNKKSAKSQARQVLLETCTPEILEGQGSNLENGGALALQCVISSCTNISKIVFEKTSVKPLTRWSSVYEGIDNTHHRALNKISGYSVQRDGTEYSALTIQHTLVIKPLILEDRGRWRCVVYAGKNLQYASQELDINIYVTPDKDIISIEPCRPVLVTGQTAQFTCTVDGIYPKPDIVWVMDGQAYNHGVANYIQHEDKKWSANDTIDLTFDHAGLVDLYCEMRIQGKKSWAKNMVTFAVKESAEVLFPDTTLTMEITPNTGFTLNCSGSGHNPYISWIKDGQPVTDTYLSIKTECANQRCTSSISSQLPSSQALCKTILKYTGIYACIVGLESPYDESPKAKSPEMTIIIPESSSLPEFIYVGYCQRYISLSCDMCESRDSNVTWLVDGEPIQNNKNVYYIREMTTKHFGKYTQLVKTESGTLKCSFNLVHDKTMDKFCSWEIAYMTMFPVVFTVIVLSTLRFCPKSKYKETNVNKEKTKKKYTEIEAVRTSGSTNNYQLTENPGQDSNTV